MECIATEDQAITICCLFQEESENAPVPSALPPHVMTSAFEHSSPEWEWRFTNDNLLILLLLTPVC